MTTALKKIKFRMFSKNIEDVIFKISNSLQLSDLSFYGESNNEIYKILENPKDEIVFNETIEFLKKNRDIKGKDILLSNNNTLTVSIE